MTKILMSKAEAAQSFSMSVRTFERIVLNEVRTVRRGQKVLVPVKELERWAEENSVLH